MNPNPNNAMTKDKYTVYLTCAAFPNKVRKSIVEAVNLTAAKDLALTLYPGYSVL